MIHLATSYTPGYPWAEPFLASLRANCNVPFTVFEVREVEGSQVIKLSGPEGNVRTPQLENRQPENLITIAPPEGIPMGMLQHGAFLEVMTVDYFPPCVVAKKLAELDKRHLNNPVFKSTSEVELARQFNRELGGADPVILFVDADMLMQRPFTDDEGKFFLNLTPEQICVGVNGFPGETLAHEAPLLRPKVEKWVIDELFPGWETLPAWNTGFVAARRSAYQRLYDMSRALMPAGVACFDHYAVVQFVMSYCIGRFLSHVELPRTIHLHGCWKLPEEATANEAGEMFFNGVKVAFRHSVNLNPPKGAQCEPVIKLSGSQVED